MEPPAMDHFRVENLSISFGGLKAVNNVSFGVEKNSIFSIIGPNGSGKTTIFNMISGIYKPDHGRIICDGEELVGLHPGSDRPQGHGPHLSEHRAVLQCHRHGQPPAGQAYPHENGRILPAPSCGGEAPGPPGRRSETGKSSRRSSIFWICNRYRNQLCGQPALRQTKTSGAGSRPGPGTRRYSCLMNPLPA